MPEDLKLKIKPSLSVYVTMAAILIELHVKGMKRLQRNA